jgi:hypothetical protein
MARKRAVPENEDIIDADFPVRIDRRSMIERFRSAIRDAGGVRAVAERSGVAKGTIDNLLGGTEFRFTAAYAIAITCKVSLDWLATGIVTTNYDAVAAKAADTPPPEPAPAPARPETLFSTLDMDRFAHCMDLVQAAFKLRKRVPQSRPLVQLATLLYDAAEDGNFATAEVEELLSGNKR